MAATNSTPIVTAVTIKTRGNAVGLIFQAAREAADSSYPDTQNQRHGEKVASRNSNAQQTLGPLRVLRPPIVTNQPKVRLWVPMDYRWRFEPSGGV